MLQDNSKMQTQLKTTPLEVARATYTDALQAFKAGIADAKPGIQTGIDAKANVVALFQGAAWCAFDVTQLLPQSERRDAGAAFGEQIAKVRGVDKDKGLRVYKARMANACDTHAEALVTFDADKRAKADPMSAVAAIERKAKKADAKTAEETARLAFKKAHGAEALRVAAATYSPPMLTDDFAALVMSGDPGANERMGNALATLEYREAFASHYPTWQERNALRETLAGLAEADAASEAAFKKA
jgi:hypothetical protein